MAIKSLSVMTLMYSSRTCLTLYTVPDESLVTHQADETRLDLDVTFCDCGFDQLTVECRPTKWLL